MKRAKCVCTIGPASGRADILSSMIRNGMDVARLNFSHGAHEEHKKYIKMIRQQSLALNKPVAVLQDLQALGETIVKSKTNHSTSPWPFSRIFRGLKSGSERLKMDASA